MEGGVNAKREASRNGEAAEKSPWKGRSARLRRSARRMKGDRASVSAEEEALERLMGRGGEGERGEGRSLHPDPDSDPDSSPCH